MSRAQLEGKSGQQVGSKCGESLFLGKPSDQSVVPQLLETEQALA